MVIGDTKRAATHRLRKAALRPFTLDTNAIEVTYNTMKTNVQLSGNTRLNIRIKALVF